MKRIVLVLTGTLTLMFASCQQQKTEGAVMAPTIEEEPVIPADFRAFYDKFHTDTNYQKEHITFPLSGLPANADTLSYNDFRWNAENWKWHRNIDPSLTGYDREWQMVTDEMVIETIIQQTSRIGMERRFAKMDNGWMLIYYAGMNPMR